MIIGYIYFQIEDDVDADLSDFDGIDLKEGKRTFISDEYFYNFKKMYFNLFICKNSFEYEYV